MATKSYMAAKFQDGYYVQDGCYIRVPEIYENVPKQALTFLCVSFYQLYKNMQQNKLERFFAAQSLFSP